MKTSIYSLLFLMLLAGCENNEAHKLLRSTDGAPSSAIGLDINIEAHEAYGDEAAHTHVLVELYGQDSGGFYYFELDEEDTLEAALDGNTVSLNYRPMPSLEQKVFVLYDGKLVGSTPASELQLTLTRTETNESLLTSIALPGLTPFSISPDTELDLNEDLIIEWTEDDNNSYALTFVYQCLDSDDEFHEVSYNYPNNSVTEISSPFTIQAQTHFSPPEELTIVSCDFTVRLKTRQALDAMNDTEYRDVYVTTLRSQSLTVQLTGL